MSRARMGGIEVRLADAADKPALAALFLEMERFYDDAAGLDRAALDPATAAERLESGAFAAGAPAEILVAETDGRIVGFACFSTLFPGENAVRLLFLKDLFTTAAARGRGVGRALMTGLARLASERGIGRIDWTTGADNVQARRLYDGIGAEARPDVVFYRLDREAIARLAASGG